MKNYVEIIFEDISTERSELLIAELSESGYEGFEEDSNILKAFILENQFDEAVLNGIAEKYRVIYYSQVIADKNWNQVWESNFQPVIVDQFVAIRADFHDPISQVQHEIVITPKMSFGTGHHPTTFMMVQQMNSIDFRGKTVLDFGTGTGVLAILAEQLGAEKIVAIDHDEWSISNAAENFLRNNCFRIELKNASTPATGASFDIILANINKNVILDNFSILVSQLRKGGVILLSGLLKDDEQEIVNTGKDYLLVYAGNSKRDNWLCLKFLC